MVVVSMSSPGKLWDENQLRKRTGFSLRAFVAREKDCGALHLADLGYS